ncbi:MAG: glycosyltransferase [Bacteroidetes bacterium]|nr:glycosyltransferase [Bacteroidota bacterium]MDA0860140.1 glycosyltransferase [Bacteroidota bacterium]MDA1318237.1 glycosyltransferase [Bacteroidota bacterium]
MLSILIPTFNYDITALVVEVHKQSKSCNIVFEILVFDDASTDLEVRKKNASINALENTSYTTLKSNIGRSAIRNKLAKSAQYNWLLFLDADVMPVNNHFVFNYIKSLSDSKPIIYGGISYQEERPNQTQLLRWVYGREREALSSEIRKKDIYVSFLTLNFIIQKDTFEKAIFNENIPNLRYEDTLFSYDLKRKKIPITHIENPVCHLGLESSEIFLSKSKESLEALNLFLKQKLINANYIRISRVKNRLQKFKLDLLLSTIYPSLKTRFEKNLLSNTPSLFIFDLYRLSYLCYISRK